MTRFEQILFLNDILLKEMPQYREQAQQFPMEEAQQRRLLRSLMNVRPPMPLNAEFLTVQDALLSAERSGKGVVDIDTLPVTADPRIILWQGDITRLAADAIVDADNSALLGCFCPCHGCIDNAIHSAAGLKLRDECHRLMQKQGHEEPAGQAKITGAYNLPSRYVIHTVGPIVRGSLTESDRLALQSCYRSCMELALHEKLHSIAFCCISTGEFHFPDPEAAQIAVETVKNILSRDVGGMKVVFNVFKDIDYRLYNELLNAD